mgnify:CR=1 FL=1
MEDSLAATLGKFLGKIHQGDCVAGLKKVPSEFWGREVIDGDKYDMRYRDDTNVIVGLKYKRVRNKLTETNKFVIQ